MAARRRVIARGAAGLVLCGLVALAWVRRAQVRSILSTLAHLHLAWVPLAVLAEFGSMAALARSQVRLLTVGGDRMPLRTAIAVVFASNALSLTVPVAGAGLGAGFSFRQFRRWVQPAMVGWALTVSGVMSALSFALVTAVGALVSGNSAALVLGLSGAAVSALPVLTLLAAVRYGTARRVLARVVVGMIDVSARLVRRPRVDIAVGLVELLDRVGAVRATPRQYTVAFVLAMRNWIADCVCLVCSIKASGGSVPWHGLVLAYCVAVAAGSSGLTPGGLGIVEATLTAGLVGAGMPTRHALPAVLVYRIISLWLVVAVGWVIATRFFHVGRVRTGPPDD